VEKARSEVKNRALKLYVAEVTHGKMSALQTSDKKHSFLNPSLSKIAARNGTESATTARAVSVAIDPLAMKDEIISAILAALRND